MAAEDKGFIVTSPPWYCANLETPGFSYLSFKSRSKRRSTITDLDYIYIPVLDEKSEAGVEIPDTEDVKFRFNGLNLVGYLLSCFSDDNTNAFPFHFLLCPAFLH